MHAGDVFGDTVNLASRLTALSEPNRVLVGPALATELANHPAYQLTCWNPSTSAASDRSHRRCCDAGPQFRPEFARDNSD